MRGLFYRLLDTLDLGDGIFYRAGALVRPAEGGLAIALVAPGSPAEAAGLKAGQLITALDGRPAAELGVAGYTALLKGVEADGATDEEPEVVAAIVNLDEFCDLVEQTAAQEA